MERFIQLHMLTSYPPANLNRDDLGRPKTALMGGRQRLRISSQCLKRTWRTSDVFEDHSTLGDRLGTRTKTMGLNLLEKLEEKGVDKDKAIEWLEPIMKAFGKTERKKKDNPERTLLHKQLVHFSPGEQVELEKLVNVLAEERREPTNDEQELVQHKHRAPDIAMFGRMMASDPKFNVEAAVQVSHALTVHKAQVEDDFFTAVDDLNTGRDDSGSAHMGQKEFGAGLFYNYICIDRHQLVENLTGDEELADQSIKALTKAATTVAPSGMQNSFGSRARANYVLGEKGNQQPRSLSVAFLEPVTGSDWLDKAVNEMEDTLSNMDSVYGDCAAKRYRMNAHRGEGSLDSLLDFLTTSEDDRA